MRFFLAFERDTRGYWIFGGFRSLTHLFRIKVTVSLLQDSSTAWSPCSEVMWPRSRMVEMLGCAEGAKACRCEGRMRGVGCDIFVWCAIPIALLDYGACECPGLFFLRARRGCVGGYGGRGVLRL